MFLNLAFAAARSIELRASQDALASAEGILKEFSSVNAIEDSKVLNDQYVIQTQDLSFNAEDKSILKDLLALTSAFKEMPKEIKEIVKSVSLATSDSVSELKTGAYNFAVVFTDEADFIKNLKGAEANSTIKLFLSTKKEEAQALGVPFPGMLSYSSADKNTIIGPIPKTYQSLLSSLNVAAFTTINQENFRFLQTLDQKLFYVIDNKMNYEESKVLFNSNAKLCASFARFLFFAPEDVPALIPLLNVQDSDYPVLVSLAKEGKGIFKGLKAETFLSGVQKLMTNQAEKLVFSSPIPSNNATLPVKVVNTESLESFIDATESDVLIAFTSPSCRFCATLEPIFKQFGQVLLDKKVSISIGSYNVIENEEPVGFELNGVPTLFFIKKGTTQRLDVPADARTLEGLLKFIEKEGVSSKINSEDFSEIIKQSQAEEKAAEEKAKEKDDEAEDLGADAL